MSPKDAILCFSSLLEQQRREFAKINPPVSPDVTAVSLKVLVRIAGRVKFGTILLIGFVQKIRAAYPNPIESRLLGKESG